MGNLILEASAGQQLIEVARQYATEDLTAHIGSASVGLLLLVGSLLMLLAGVGLIRLPDLPTRMHASTKAGSLGAALIMAAVAVAMPDAGVVARVVAVVAFLLLTAPVAAHVIGRAGYFVGVPLWKGTVKDDLAGQYDFESYTLASGDLGGGKIEEGDEEEEEVEQEEEEVEQEEEEEQRNETGDSELQEISDEGEESEENSEELVIAGEEVSEDEESSEENSEGGSGQEKKKDEAFQVEELVED